MPSSTESPLQSPSCPRVQLFVIKSTSPFVTDSVPVRLCPVPRDNFTQIHSPVSWAIVHPNGVARSTFLLNMATQADSGSADRPFLRFTCRIAEEVEEDGLGEGVELGEGGAALGPQRLRPVQHLRNPPLLSYRRKVFGASSTNLIVERPAQRNHVPGLTSASPPTPSSPAESPPPAWPARPESPSAGDAPPPHAQPLYSG